MIILLGILANVVFVAAGFFKMPKHSMIGGVIGNLIFIEYYFLLGLYTPIIALSITAVANLIVVNTNSQKTIKTIAIISAIVITLMISTNISSAYEILLIASAWSMCLSQIEKNNYITHKLLKVLAQCFWIAYCMHFSDYAMMTTCLFICSSNLYSLIYNMHKDGLLTSFNLKYINN